MKKSGLFFVAAVLLAIGCGWWLRIRPVENLPPPAPDGVQQTRWAPVFDAATPSSERLALARHLDSSFPLASVGPWVRESPTPGDLSVTPETYEIYSEILDQARQRNLYPETLSPFLISQINDSSLDPVLRDYAVQQLGLWLNSAESGQPAETDPGRRQDGLTALCRAAQDESLYATTIPGTALLTLADIATKTSADLSAFQPGLDSAIAAILGDRLWPAGLRVSAIQAAAMAARTEHLPAIRDMLASTAPESPEFLSAISAIGQLGDATDRELLLSFSTSNPLAAKAITSAISRLPQ